MWKNVHPVSGAGIRTDKPSDYESTNLTTRLGLPPT